MQRISVPTRPNWQKHFEDLGFSFHSMEGGYWSEGLCYQFSAMQIDCLEEVTQELHSMCLAAVDYVVSRNLFAQLGLGDRAAALIRHSWQQQDPSLYGRFDFSYDGFNEPKLLEYNADTPTALYEASIAQWVWLEGVFPQHDQFNSIHEHLLDAFSQLREKIPATTACYFTSVRDHEEDLVTVEYMRDVASQTGLATRHIFIEDIGFNSQSSRFVGLDNEEIRYIFKLYPWEWLLGDDFGQHIMPETVCFFEPAWKMVLSSKGIPPILWEMFPGHKNLLPSFFEPSPLKKNYVRKPLWGREGSNIDVVRAGRHLSTAGSYGREGYIYQAFQELPDFSGRFPVVGSWIVNGVAAGIGIREDEGIITKNTSCFVPHYFIS